MTAEPSVFGTTAHDGQYFPQVQAVVHGNALHFLCSRIFDRLRMTSGKPGACFR
jgi:hypothetical protein